uniref:TIL domain-containing protein n=1 Tax=Trichuris muris TaxID=70415 RepID=A0A5S6QQ94_TRIMR
MKTLIFTIFLLVAIGSYARKCGPNQVYLRCGSACPSTCRSIRRPARPKICTLQCVRGCFCKRGYVLNDAKQCIPKRKCYE